MAGRNPERERFRWCMGSGQPCGLPPIEPGDQLGLRTFSLPSAMAIGSASQRYSAAIASRSRNSSGYAGCTTTDMWPGMRADAGLTVT